MESIGLLFEQLEDAKSFLKRDTEYGYRIAYILIDNLTELVLRDQANDGLDHEAMMARLQLRMRELTPESELKERGFYREILTEKDIKKIRFVFGDKVRYLADSLGIDDVDQECLLFLHAYRNQAFHHNNHNVDDLYAYLLAYFQVCLRLLKSSRIRSMGSDEAAEMDKTFRRHGATNGWHLMTSGHQEFVESYSTDVQTTPIELGELLIKSVDHRVQNLRDAVDFLNENSVLNVDEIYASIDFYRLEGRYPTLEEHNHLHSEFGPTALDSWTESSRSWPSYDRVESIVVGHGTLVATMDPYAEAADSLAADLDSAIRMEIDIARGK